MNALTIASCFNKPFLKVVSLLSENFHVVDEELVNECYF